MTASSDELGDHDPKPIAQAADEFKAALDDTVKAMDNLSRTWDTRLADTLRQLDQLQRQVTVNLQSLRQHVTNHH